MKPLFGAVVILTTLLAMSASASPALLSYQGKITKIDGTPLEISGVAFDFRITSPDGLCVLYREQKNGVDMTNSKGLFDVPIGGGVKSFPADPAITLAEVFSNKSVLDCSGGGTYLPALDDPRRLRVQFHDGTGWFILDDSTIRSVPFALYAREAISASKLGTKTAGDFLLKTGIPTCTNPGDVLTSTMAGILTCTAGGGGATGVTSLTAGTGLSGTGTTGAITVSIATGGVTATQLASDAVITAKILDGNVTAAKLADVAGLTAGAYGTATAIPAVTVDAKGRVTAITTNSITGLLPTAAGATGKYLKSDGSNWSGDFIRFSDIKNTAGTASAFNVGSCAANETVAWSSLTDSFGCQPIGSLGSSSLSFPLLSSTRGDKNTAVYGFNGDPNTGIFSPAADTVAITAGGNDSLSVYDVGVSVKGQYPLDINNDIGGLAFSRSGGKGMALSFYPGTDGSAAPVTAYIDHDGGTNEYLTLGVKGESGNSGIMRLETAGVTRVEIDEKGYVGLGTVPSSPLHVNASFGDLSGSPKLNYFYGIANPSTASVATFYGSNGSIAKFSNANLAGAAMIGSAGVVEQGGTGTIGTATGVEGFITRYGTGDMDYVSGVYSHIWTDKPGTINYFYGLQVQTDVSGGAVINNAYGVLIRDLAGTNSYGIYQQGANDENYFAGNVGIGTNNPQAKLHVVGNLRVDTLNAATATQVCIDGNNVLSACSSSIRYKENVFGLNSSLETILKLRPVSYDWIQSKEHDVGFIAEEVEKVEPRLVTYNKEGRIQGVKYDQIVSPLVKAFQELYTYVIGTREDVEKLNREIASISAENAQLKVQDKAKSEKIQDLESRLEKIEKLLNSK